jgi:hypothetical protein
MPCRCRFWSLAAIALIAACGKKETPPAEVPASAPLASAPIAAASQASAPEVAASGPEVAASAPARVELSSVTLGKAVGDDAQTTTPADVFAAGDTIHASVSTEGAGSATLSAKWTFDKKRRREILAEVTVTIAPTGPTTTAFGLARPAGLPPGDYELEIVLDGQSVATRSFKVQKAVVARRKPPDEKQQAQPANGTQPSSAQLHAASLVYYGRYECELGQTMTIRRSGQGGYVDLRAGRYRATLAPVLSPTGAVRLEQVRGGALLVVQIPSKSILFNQKAGRRLIDDCRHAQQKIEAAAAAREDNSLGMNLRGQVPDGAKPATAAGPR